MSEDVKAKLDAGALIVDVRTPEEFAGGSYPGALNIPLADVNDRLSEFGDDDGSIVVFCRSGNRSGQAQDILTANGYTDVVNGGGLGDMPPKG